MTSPISYNHNGGPGDVVFPHQVETRGQVQEKQRDDERDREEEPLPGGAKDATAAEKQADQTVAQWAERHPENDISILSDATCGEQRNDRCER